MERNISTKGIAVSSNKSGEKNRFINLISPTLGHIDVLVYGAQNKRKVPLFSSGTFFLYFNPVRKTYTLTDYSMEIDSSPVFESLEKTYSASYLGELFSKTGLGQEQEIYQLLYSAISALIDENADYKIIVIQATWKLMALGGVASPLEVCPGCDKKYGEKEILAFSTLYNSPCCIDCADIQTLILPPGARRYLHYTYFLSFDDSIKVKLSSVACFRIFRFMLNYAEHYAQRPLRSLADGVLEKL